MAVIRNLKWILICLSQSTVTPHLRSIWIAAMNTFLGLSLYLLEPFVNYCLHSILIWELIQWKVPSYNTKMKTRIYETVTYGDGLVWPIEKRSTGVSIISKNGVFIKLIFEVWVFYKYAKLSFFYKKEVVFSCPGQLNRWPCHSLTHSLSDWILISTNNQSLGSIKEWP